MYSMIMRFFGIWVIALLLTSCGAEENPRIVQDFNQDWYFNLGEVTNGENQSLNHQDWRPLNLPHDWSIEGEFSMDHPATAGGGALPGGIGWYRKSFSIDESKKNKHVFVQFDGIYMNSEVWINGQYLGKRPFGYISFEYDLTPYLNYGQKENIIAVKVDNSQQPNSRWYSGSGIYRNTRLVFTEDIFVPQWGTYITTPEVSTEKSKVVIKTKIYNQSNKEDELELLIRLYNQEGSIVAKGITQNLSSKSGLTEVTQEIEIISPQLWQINDPYLYKAISQIMVNGRLTDQYETTFGIREFVFDQNKGFILNGKSEKIKGVCMHHDLGCLGSAVNTRAIERQLEILRGMGVNAIRTSHNPPAPELLELCDQMGFFVMDETFDIWSMKKSPYDYSLYWDEWHTRDLTDHILRDRNHPSVFTWSIGNEINDQWHPIGDTIANELVDLVRTLDITRPITAAMNPPSKESNSIARSGALDLIGYNYHHQMYEKHHEAYPTNPFIGSETSSALATRGYYDQKSDTIKRWPISWDKAFVDGNPNNTVSAYDQISAPWGSTHEETWRIIKKNDFMSGIFIWTGFDYLGEPTPYDWPSRSSYFGVIDLAGFPKDSYYMYQSEWRDEDMLHVFPHWNWTDRDSVDVWAYFNADQAELFLNGQSLGKKTKTEDEFHAMWRVAYTPGEIKVVTSRNNEVVMQKTIATSTETSSIRLTPDRVNIKADGKDLSFVTVEILDTNNNPIATANQLVTFSVKGNGRIVGVDNGDPTSHLSLKGNEMNVFNGKALVVIQSNGVQGDVVLTAVTKDLKETSVIIRGLE